MIEDKQEWMENNLRKIAHYQLSRQDIRPTSYRKRHQQVLQFLQQLLLPPQQRSYQ